MESIFIIENPSPKSLFQSFCWLQVVWDFAGTKEGNLVWDLPCKYYCWVLWGLFLLLAHKNVFLSSQVELE